MQTYQVLTSYTHTQDVPSTEWNVQHYLKTYPSIDAIISHNGKFKKVLPLSVQYIDPDTCKITFSNPQSGVAKVS